MCSHSGAGNGSECIPWKPAGVAHCRGWHCTRGNAQGAGDRRFVGRPVDAVSLAAALADAQDLDAALMTWQHDRLAQGARMTEWGINMGNRIMGIAQS